MYKIVEEGKAKIGVYTSDRVSRALPVFYNPVMKLNRDISILLLNSLGRKGLQIADPLAGSGIRSIRFLLELRKGIIKNLSINDLSQDAIRNISKNLKLNKIKPGKHQILLSNEDANMFLLKSTGFDYIDIDPFGTPCPFLDTAITRLSRGGILAVTATDTAALAGSSKTACLRKYWSIPMKNELMHEIGIRILIRRVQLIGAEHEKALIPIFSYADQHYYRVFLRCEKGKEKADATLRSHKYFLYNPKTLERRLSGTIFNKEEGWIFAGPLWAGQLWDKGLVKKMSNGCAYSDVRLTTLMKIISDECRADCVGFYTIPLLARALGLKELAKRETIIKSLEKAIFAASRTHLDGQGIRTGASLKDIRALLISDNACL